jgi:hypothetical protein
VLLLVGWCNNILFKTFNQWKNGIVNDCSLLALALSPSLSFSALSSRVGCSKGKETEVKTKLQFVPNLFRRSLTYFNGKRKMTAMVQTQNKEVKKK